MTVAAGMRVAAGGADAADRPVYRLPAANGAAAPVEPAAKAGWSPAPEVEGAGLVARRDLTAHCPAILAGLDAPTPQPWGPSVDPLRPLARHVDGVAIGLSLRDSGEREGEGGRHPRASPFNHTVVSEAPDAAAADRAARDFPPDSSAAER